MKTLLCFVVAVALISGCATTRWVATTKTDQFTDVTTKTAHVNIYGAPYGIYTLSFFVSTRTNLVFVGVRNDMGFPVGTVQLRIDQNPAIEISPMETPVLLAPSSGAPAQMLAGMSPFTAATGEKAAAILKELVHGKVLRFRLIGINQAASTTGEIKLDPSFISAVVEIGIDPKNY